MPCIRRVKIYHMTPSPHLPQSVEKETCEGEAWVIHLPWICVFCALLAVVMSRSGNSLFNQSIHLTVRRQVLLRRALPAFLCQAQSSLTITPCSSFRAAIVKIIPSGSIESASTYIHTSCNCKDTVSDQNRNEYVIVNSASVLRSRYTTGKIYILANLERQRVRD